MIKNIEFKEPRNQFQEKLQKEQKQIKNEPKLLIAADKTSNFYKVKPDEYKKLLEKEVNKEYKKVTDQNVKKVNNAHKKIVVDLGISDRVFKTSERECFITLKDHKPNFQNSPSCRLLNPMKCEVGKISHQKLSKIIEIVRKKSKLNQWKNSYSCIDWFKELKGKRRLSFIIFDIVNFYPSISPNLLNQALKWTEQFVNISAEDQRIILASRKSFLVKNGEFWAKKENPEFDVPMGAYDSAEICDLVGLFILSEIEKLGVKANFGLYKDDGLAASGATPQQVENIKKAICAKFKELGLKITIEANLKKVQFLDVEFNLSDDTYRPYLKENDVPLYVHKDSNHPPCVAKNIPAAINKRLTALSSSKEMFESVAQGTKKP